jgi:hypothetical protein
MNRYTCPGGGARESTKIFFLAAFATFAVAVNGFYTDTG